MTVPLHFIRRTVAVALTSAALAVALQIAPASAGQSSFQTFGPFSSLAACNYYKMDLDGSGVTQPCFLRDGQWYFKFAQQY